MSGILAKVLQITLAKFFHLRIMPNARDGPRDSGARMVVSGVVQAGGAPLDEAALPVFPPKRSAAQDPFPDRKQSVR